MNFLGSLDVVIALFAKFECTVDSANAKSIMISIYMLPLPASDKAGLFKPEST